MEESLAFFLHRTKCDLMSGGCAALTVRLAHYEWLLTRAPAMHGSFGFGLLMSSGAGELSGKMMRPPWGKCRRGRWGGEVGAQAQDFGSTSRCGYTRGLESRGISG